MSHPFSIESILNLAPELKARELRVRNRCIDTSSGSKCVHPNWQTDAATNITVELQNNEIWQDFHNIGTEMIVTKVGRRMFPTLRYKAFGLQPKALYDVSLSFQEQDNLRYKYVYHHSKWTAAGIGETCCSTKEVDHHDNPMTGEFLLNHLISFDRVKLTNKHILVEASKVELRSMQKYVPILIISRHIEEKKLERAEFVLPQTSFIAVTAYQNQQITQLKIARNPFAKGFRTAGKRRYNMTELEEYIKYGCIDILGYSS